MSKRSRLAGFSAHVPRGVVPDTEGTAKARPPTNFRDAAGACGRVRPGILFRSALPRTPEELRYLRGFTLVDLRTRSERRSFGDARAHAGPRDVLTRDLRYRDVSGSAGQRDRRLWIEASLFQETSLFLPLVERVGMRRILPGLLARVADRRRSRMLTGAVINQLGLEELLKIMLRASRASLPLVIRALSAPQHLPSLTFCSAGKDRTGFLWALLLVSLGATFEEAAADFAISEGDLMRDGAYYSALSGELVAVGMDPSEFLASPEQTMLNVLDMIKRQSGSVEAFLAEAGFSSAEQEALRRRLCT